MPPALGHWFESSIAHLQAEQKCSAFLLAFGDFVVILTYCVHYANYSGRTGSFDG